MEEGVSLSTRRIADAAGIAEGTIFRVFATKEALVREAINSYLDLGDLVERVDAIGPELTLDEKIPQILAIVAESAQRGHTFLAAMKGHRWLAGGGSHHQFAVQAIALRTAVMRALTPNEHELYVSLDIAATHILTIGLASLIMSTAFPSLDPQATASILLRGLTRKDVQ